MQHQHDQRTVLRWSLQFQSVESVFKVSILPQGAFFKMHIGLALFCPMPQLHSCVSACNRVGHTCIAKLLFRSLQETYRTCKFACVFFSRWCQQRNASLCIGKSSTELVALKCDKYQFSRFFIFGASSKSSGESVHWTRLDWAFVVLKCDKYQIPDFFSRLTQAAKAQARLCIGKSFTEPSLLENAITVQCEIFQIKHWNINKRVIRTYFLRLSLKTHNQNTYSGPATNIKILNHGLRVLNGLDTNGLDTDHDWLSVGPDLGPNYLQLLTVDKSRHLTYTCSPLAPDSDHRACSPQNLLELVHLPYFRTLL